MHAENYVYTTTETPEGITTVLTRKKDGKTKTFFRAAHGQLAVDGTNSLMESLTDVCCDGFFPAARVKVPATTKE